jgi:hypothetical protein
MKSEIITIYAGWGQDSGGQDDHVTGYSLTREGAKLSTKGHCWGEFGNVTSKKAIRLENGDIYILGDKITLVEDKELIAKRKKEIISKLDPVDAKILGLT